MVGRDVERDYVTGSDQDQPQQRNLEWTVRERVQAKTGGCVNLLTPSLVVVGRHQEKVWERSRFGEPDWSESESTAPTVEIWFVWEHRSHSGNPVGMGSPLPL